MDSLTFSRQLRRNATEAERRLWRYLRNRRMGGAKFRRQVPLGPYIVDFLCIEAALVIEVDGGQHAESEADLVRDAWLREQGFAILRFWNRQVLAETRTVLETIHGAVETRRRG